MKGNPRSPMFILFLVVFIDMIGFTIVIPFLTYFVQDLATSDGIIDTGRRDLWVGIIISVYSFAQFIFTPILGSLSDRVGRRPILLFGLFMNTIFFTVFGLSGSLMMALAARFLAGAGNGNIAVARAYIGDISSPDMVASRMGAIGAAFGLGFMIGPFIGGLLSNPASGIGGPFDTTFWKQYPYLLPCLLSSVLSLLSLFLAFTKLPESLEIRSEPKEEGIFIGLYDTLKNIRKITQLPIISTLVFTNFLFIMGFSMIHGIFILFTAMNIEDGGLGFDAMENGWVFAYIGLLGVIVQGGLIGKLTKMFDLSKLMIFGTIICGIGIASIPYVPGDISWLIFISSTFIAIGNGLFSPTQSSLLTFESSKRGYELGMVMGAQEGYGALARIFGPLLAAYLWSLTVEGSGFWTYHTSFRVAGIIFIIALILQLKLLNNLKISINLPKED